MMTPRSHGGKLIGNENFIIIFLTFLLLFFLASRKFDAGADRRGHT